MSQSANSKFLNRLMMQDGCKRCFVNNSVEINSGFVLDSSLIDVYPCSFVKTELRTNFDS